MGKEHSVPLSGRATLPPVPFPPKALSGAHQGAGIFLSLKPTEPQPPGAWLPPTSAGTGWVSAGLFLEALNCSVAVWKMGASQGNLAGQQARAGSGQPGTSLLCFLFADFMIFQGWSWDLGP